jgi:hypothetical protein
MAEFAAGIPFCQMENYYSSAASYFPKSPDPFYGGLKEAYLFDPFTEAWERLPDLQVGRWYPTWIRLADAHVLTLSIGLSPTERKPQNKVSTSHNRKEGSNDTKINPVRA